MTDRVNRPKLLFERLADARIEAQPVRGALDETELTQALHGLRGGVLTQERCQKRAAGAAHDTSRLECAANSGVRQILKEQLSQARNDSRAVRGFEIEARALGGRGECQLERERVALRELDDRGDHG